MTEKILIERNKDTMKRNEAAMLREAKVSLAGFKELYLQWLTPVFRYFYSRTGNIKDAEDLTSQVFLEVYQGLPRYRDHGCFSAWLFTIARNKAVDFFRTAVMEVSLEIIDPADGSDDLLTQAVHSDEIQRLDSLIRSLPDEEQELIRLRYVANLGYCEIGEVFNRKDDAMRKTISRMLVRLQSQLEENHE